MIHNPRKIPLLPVPAGLTVRIVHIHDPARLERLARKGCPPPRYVTIARVYDAHNNDVASSMAFCNPKDCPSRKAGRAIAHNRAVSAYLRSVALAHEELRAS